MTNDASEMPLRECRWIFSRVRTAEGADEPPKMSDDKKAPQECPCGFFNDAHHDCLCSPLQISRYLAKISGPLLDRIDLQVEVPALSPEEIASTELGEPSAAIRDRVDAARAIQRERFRRSSAVQCNGDMTTRLMRRHCELDAPASRILEQALRRLGLSARAYDRVLKVARTIADLAGADRIESAHVAEAVQYRALDRAYFRKTA
jgi:magnesium chelatase family protein